MYSLVMKEKEHLMLKIEVNVSGGVKVNHGNRKVLVEQDKALIRSPLWVGGGVTFGPDNKNWKRSINKKMVRKGLSMILSRDLKDEELSFVKYR
jgi:hypothetical protein